MGKKRKKPEGLTVKHQGGPSPSGDGRNWVHFPVNFRGALHTYLTCQTISCMYLGILGTLAVNRSMPILYGSARLLPERERLKYDLKPSLADLRPTFQQDWDLCRSSLHVGWPGGPIWSLIFGTDQIRAAESSGLQAGVAYEAIMKPLILYLKEVAAKIVSYNLLHLIQSMWLPFSPIPEPSQCLGSP